MIQLYHKFYPHSGMVLQINTLVHCLFFIYGQKKMHWANFQNFHKVRQSLFCLYHWNYFEK